MFIPGDLEVLFRKAIGIICWNMVSLQTFIMSDPVGKKKKIADMPDVSVWFHLSKDHLFCGTGAQQHVWGSHVFTACGQLHELTVPESVTLLGAMHWVPAAGWWFSAPGIQGSSRETANSITRIRFCY